MQIYLKTLDYLNWRNQLKYGYIFSIKELLKRGYRPIVTIYMSFMCRSSWTNVEKNINIKGIVINNQDIIQLLLGGTEKSLREKLQTLSKFINLSGLKINEENQSNMDWFKK